MRPARRANSVSTEEFTGPPEPSFFQRATSYLSSKFDKLTTPFDTGFTPEASTFAKAGTVAVVAPKKAAAAAAKTLRSAFVPLIIGAFVVLFLVLITRNLANKVTS